MGTRSHQYKFTGPPHMILPHHHHHWTYHIVKLRSPISTTTLSSVSLTSRGAFVLHGQNEAIPHSVVAPTQVTEDTQARIERIEQRMRSLHVTDEVMS